MWISIGLIIAIIIMSIVAIKSEKEKDELVEKKVMENFAKMLEKRGRK